MPAIGSVPGEPGRPNWVQAPATRSDHRPASMPGGRSPLGAGFGARAIGWARSGVCERIASGASARADWLARRSATVAGDARRAVDFTGAADNQPSSGYALGLRSNDWT